MIHRRSGVRAIDAGLERLVGLLESMRHLPAAGVCEQVVARMGHHREDDTVAVCIRRSAPPS